MNDEDFFAQLEEISQNYSQDEILDLLRTDSDFGEDYVIKAQDYFSNIDSTQTAVPEPEVSDSLMFTNSGVKEIKEEVEDDMDSFWIVDDNPNEVQKIINSGIASGMLARIVAKAEGGGDLDYDKLVYYNKVLKENQAQKGDVLQSDNLVAGFALDAIRAVGQSLVSFGAAAPVGAAGAAVGAGVGSFVPVVGSAAGATAGFAGATSLAIEYANSMMSSLQEAGVDIYDDDRLESAFNDPEKMKEARQYALKRGIPIAVFDAISGGTGGKIAKGLRAAGRSKTASVLGEVGVQMGLGMAGETSGQLVAGDELSPREILLEGFAELVPAAPGMMVEYAKSVSKGKPLPESAVIDEKISNDIKEENDSKPEAERLSEEELVEKTEKTLMDANKVPDFLLNENSTFKETNKAIKELEGFLATEETEAGIEAIEKELVSKKKFKEKLIRSARVAFSNLPKESRQKVQEIMSDIESSPTEGAASEYFEVENRKRKVQIAKIFRDNILNKKETPVTPEQTDVQDARFSIVEEGESLLKSDQSDVDNIISEMNNMSPDEIQFVPPKGEQISVDPIQESKSTESFTDEDANELGFSNKEEMTKLIEYFDGIPMIFGVSDIAAGGTVVDAIGSPMEAKGGIMFNALAKVKAAWAGVKKEKSQEQYENAKRLYKENKTLFDRLWSEGKIPDGHIPMAITRMANKAIDSNEIVFRYLSPEVKAQTKENQKAALSNIVESLSVSKKGTSKNILNFISNNNINTLGQLLDSVIKDANNRAKGDTNTLTLNERADIFAQISIDEGVKSPNKEFLKSLYRGVENNSQKFSKDSIYKAVGEPSMMKASKGDIVSIVGIDVKNGGVVEINHPNYGTGPAGRLIALIKNPVNGVNVFPTWRAKTARVFKEDKVGRRPSEKEVSGQTMGTFPSDIAFQGDAPISKMTDLQVLLGKLKFAFPKVTLVNTIQEFNDVINQPDVRTKVSDKKTILGMTKDGKIYLNPESESLSTPIHEYGHIWIDYLRSKSSGETGTNLLNRGLKLVEGTEALKVAIGKYGDNAIAREEALVELMATKGNNIISAAKKSKFKNWLNATFKYIKEKFIRSDKLFGKEEIKALTKRKNKKEITQEQYNKSLKKIQKSVKSNIASISIEDFINTGLADLFKGEAVSSKFDAKKESKGVMPRFKKETPKVSMGKAKSVEDFDLIESLLTVELPDPKKWQKTERTGFSKFIIDARRKVQDKYIDFIKLQEDVTASLKEQGMRILENQDLINALSLFDSKTNSMMEKTTGAVMENVASLLKKAKISNEEFGDILYALTAIERNRELSKRAQEKGIKSDKNSGMTDIEAKEILDRYGVSVQLDDSGVAIADPDHKQIKNKNIREAVEENLKLLKETRDRGVESGLYSKELIDSYEKQFKYYAPLRGFADPEIRKKVAKKKRELKDSSVGFKLGDPFLEMEGRTTKAYNPFDTSISLANSVLIKANKNKVKQRLFNLAQMNPNANIWKTHTIPTNKIQSFKNSFNKPENENGLVNVFFNGREMFVEMSQAMANTMNGTASATPSQFQNALNSFAVINRYLSKVITSLNPEFILGNFTRDMPTAIFNLMAEKGIDLGGVDSAKTKKIALDAVSKVMSSMRAIYNVEGLKPGQEKQSESKLEKRYREFVEDGAKTGWFYQRSPEELAKKMEGLMDDKGKGKKTIKALADYVDRVNTSVENAIRLSTYSALIDAGVPRFKAAEIAKELTVNFNKSGEWGRAANSLYLFFNASTQGTARLLKSLKPRYEISEGGGKKLVVTNGQYMALGIVTLGAMNSLLNEMMSDRDEDESYYSKIPEYIRERNIVIMNPFSKKKGDYFKIPLPYGLNVFYVIGNSLSNAAQGIQSQNSIANQVFQTAAGSFSPINYPNSESTVNFLAKFVMPTVGQPFLATALNENYFGSKIYNENFPFATAPKPESQLGRGKRTFFEGTAKALNKASGGDKYTSGFVDVNPDLMAFWADFMFGGTGKFIRRTSELPGKLFEGKEVDPREVPFLRVFAAQTDDYNARNKYYEDILIVGQLYKKAEGGGFDDPVEKKRVVQMERVRKSVTSALRKINKAESLADKIEDAEKRQDRFDYLERLEKEEIKKFLRAYKKYKIDDLR